MAFRFMAGGSDQGLGDQSSSYGKQFGQANRPLGSTQLGANRASSFMLDPTGSLIKGLGGGTEPGQQPSFGEISPELGKIRESQQQQSDLFSKNKGSMARDQFGIEAESGRADLAKQIAGINRGYGGRGMLYSGGNMGAQMGAKSGLASSLAGQRSQINSALDKQGEDLSTNAINTGNTMRDMQQQINLNKYRDALERYQQRMQQNSGMGVWTAGANKLVGGENF